MKILVIGGGGREHTIVWKIAQSPKVEKIYCAPGNAGIAALAECVPIGVTEFDRLADFAGEHQIDLTVVGPDDPLAEGIVDVFEKRNLRVFGPTADAAILEASKAFAKNLMEKYEIPTAKSEIFTDPDQALSYVRTAPLPLILKASGLALGKGVLICRTREEAEDGVAAIMVRKQFGDAGNTLVAEECLTGREVSVLAFSDGKTIRVMSSAQDHKRAKDGDKGLNTGGMGTFSPSPFYTDEIHNYCMTHIYQKTIDAMRKEGRTYKGVLYFGLMLTDDGPKVLEYNARFGDPEAQVVLPRMKNDLVDVMLACIDGTLDQVELTFEDNAAVCVVLASDGYPLSYETGYPITGLSSFDGRSDAFVFHAGTKCLDGKVVTAGGRVLDIVALGKDIPQARKKAYEAAEQIHFDNKTMRHDIAESVS